MYEACDVNLDEYFKFCFVRHPYTRFQSAYTYFNEVTDTAKNAGFTNYEQMMDWIVDTDAVKLHVKPQSYWYDDRIDQCFKFEQLEKLSLDKFIAGLNYNKRSGKIFKSDYVELDYEDRYRSAQSKHLKFSQESLLTDQGADNES